MCCRRQIHLAILASIASVISGGAARREDLAEAWAIALGVNRLLQSQQLGVTPRNGIEPPTG